VYRTRFGSLLTAAADGRSARRVSDDVQTRWREFSRTGVPGPDRPASTHTERAVMVFDRKSRVISDPHSERRIAWEGFTLATR
jgi:para-nitrobenzyl esterase